MPIPINIPVFPPSSFILLSFAWFYMFFSAGQVLLSNSPGVLHALLCLKLYSWCIHGERCTTSPPAPPPTYSSNTFPLTSLLVMNKLECNKRNRKLKMKGIFRKLSKQNLRVSWHKLSKKSVGKRFTWIVMQLKITLMDVTDYLWKKSLLPEQVYNADGLVLCSYQNLTHSPWENISSIKE